MPVNQGCNTINGGDSKWHTNIHGRTRHSDEHSPYQNKRPKEQKPSNKTPLVLQEVASTRPRRHRGVTILVETAFRQGSVPGDFGVELLCRHRRSLARLCLCKSVGTVFDKFEDAPRTSFNQSPMQRGEALFVGRVDACAPAEEEIDALGKALVSSPHQRRVAKGVDDINGNSLVQE
ncbi:hypothetical protein HG531_011259 [Fusarium graminearum]|nr:hypothetical protein HG531_011259 [Fusarium graminearum]